MYSEKERVPLFKQVCDSSASAEEKTHQLAQLMNDSQDSCRCPTPSFACESRVHNKAKDFSPHLHPACTPHPAALISALS